VPQSAIFNSLLFLLYINSLPMNMQGAMTDLLADDTNILIKAEYGNILNWKLNRLLKELTNWVKLSWFNDKY
jgi:hypothetical protein